MPALMRRWLPLALLALGALWLRTHDLARRPMHADEANQGVKAGELLETGDYAFDPSDHHGPTLYYAVLPLARIRGETTLAALTETTVRLVPALFGTLAVLLLLALTTPNPKLKTQNSEPWAFTPLAAAFLAISPPAAYYSRYFIQETLLLTFILAAFAATQRWWRTGHNGWALAAGASIGLAQATKATAPLFLLAAALAFAATRPPRPAAARLTRPIALALFAAIFIAAAFYTSFGQNLAGLNDAFATYTHAFTRAGGSSGHEKPWWYYLHLFAWLRDGGLTFHQLAFTSFAVAGAAVAWFARPSTHRALLRGASLYTLLLLLAFSLTPYKTPWHAIHLVPGLAVLAAGALVALPRGWLVAPLAAAALYLQFTQTKLVAFTRPADARNPYAYVHSAPDVLKIRSLAEAALARSPDGVIRVISEEYWPLPWYLRGYSRVGYWTTPPDTCDGALVIASAAHAETVRARLTGRYRESLLGLRPGFLCVVFTPEP